jgi:hypothetical protein
MRYKASDSEEADDVAAQAYRVKARDIRWYAGACDGSTVM